MGTVPATDKGFIDWTAQQQPKELTKHGTAYCMNLYVQNLNFEERILYDQKLKEYNDKLLSMEGAEPTPSAEPIEVIAVEGNDANDKNIPTSLNIPTTLNIPNPQNSPTSSFQNTSLPEPQNNSSPPAHDPPLQSNPFFRHFPPLRRQLPLELNIYEGPIQNQV